MPFRPPESSVPLIGDSITIMLTPEKELKGKGEFLGFDQETMVVRQKGDTQPRWITLLSGVALIDLWKDADEEISERRDTIKRLADLDQDS